MLIPFYRKARKVFNCAEMLLSMTNLGKLWPTGHICPFVRLCPIHANINQTIICLFTFILKCEISLFIVCGDEQAKNDFSLIQ